MTKAKSNNFINKKKKVRKNSDFVLNYLAPMLGYASTITLTFATNPITYTTAIGILPVLVLLGPALSILNSFRMQEQINKLQLQINRIASIQSLIVNSIIIYVIIIHKIQILKIVTMMGILFIYFLLFSILVILASLVYIVLIAPHTRCIKCFKGKSYKKFDGDSLCKTCYYQWVKVEVFFKMNESDRNQYFSKFIYGKFDDKAIY